MTRARWAVTVIAAVAVLGATLAPPAQAATRVFHDRVGDVNSRFDVKRIRVENGQRLVLRAQHVDVSRRSTQSIGYFIDVDGTRPGPEYAIGATFSSYGEWNMFRTRGWRVAGAPLDCPTNLVLGYTSNFTQFSVSRSCLKDDHGRIRVSMSASEYRKDGSSVNDYYPRKYHFTPWINYQ
jgi:hypothetical protein